jgi:hypothetical protein
MTEADAIILARAKGSFKEIMGRLSIETNMLAGVIAGMGGRFEYADTDAIERQGRVIAWVSRQINDANDGRITWDEARVNTFAVSAYAWVDRGASDPELAATVAKRRIELWNELRDLIPGWKPPSIRDEIASALTDMSAAYGSLAELAGDEAAQVGDHRAEMERV